MRYLLFLLITLFLTFKSQSQVRKTKWGMTKKEVISSESIKPLLNDSDGLAYKVKLAGIENYLFYFFNSDGKLLAAAYNISEKYASENSYLSDYLNLLEKLQEKYGEGTADMEWSNELFKDEKQKWGLAISAEHLKISHKWETDDTNIMMVISGKNYEVSVSIRYTSTLLPMAGNGNDLDDF